jgi:hypothetical protein
VQCSLHPGFNPSFFDTTISAGALYATGASYTTTLRKLGTLPIVLDTMFCRWYIIGTNDALGIEKNSMFEFGWSRPKYEGVLNADSTLMGDRVHLNWTAVPAGTDSIRIWHDTKPIPLDHTIPLLLSEAHYVNNMSQTADTVKGLTNNVLYHFGLQIFKDQMWSAVTPASSDSAKTSKGDTSRVDNLIVLDSLRFIDSTNTIKAFWHVDFSKLPTGKKYESAYSYSLDGYINATQPPSTWSLADSGFNVSSIPLYPKIVFDTLYTVGLWLRGTSVGLGPGQPSPPVAASTDTIRTPAFTWETITIFPDTVNEILAANKRIIIQNPGSAVFDHTNKLNSFTITPPLPDGFTAIGGAYFSFENPNIQLPPFLVGLRYDTPLPQGIAEKDLALYTCRDGQYFVVHESYVYNDAVWDTIRTGSEIMYPFVILADTKAPVIGIVENVDPVKPDEPVSTKFMVTDNCANIKWRFQYGSGNGGFTDSLAGYLSSSGANPVNTIIPVKGSIINESFGVRACLVVSDKNNRDSVDVSRRVETVNVGEMSAIAREWIPLRAPASLVEPDIAKIFQNSMSGDSVWQYNTYKYRLYRWYTDIPDSGNHWVEYSDITKDSFSLVPGRLLWFKPKENKVVKLGAGVTTSLKMPYEIVLKPQSWTDLSSPFQFPILLRDIIDATDSVNAAELEVYHWKQSDSIYEPVEVFIGKLPPPETLSVIEFRSEPKFDGYTVFNHSSASVSLKIPPVSKSLSRYRGMERRQTRQQRTGWEVDVLWRTAGSKTAFNRVRCVFGYRESPAIEYGALPPSMNPVRAGVVDTATATMHGWALCPAPGGEGTSVTVRLLNVGLTNRTTEYYLERTGTLPEGYTARMFDPRTLKFEDLAHDKTSSVELGPGQSSDRMIVAGTEAFFDRLVVSRLPVKLLKAFPNPFRDGLVIRYRLPAGIKKAEFALYNLNGRIVRREIVSKAFAAGEHTIGITRSNNAGTLSAGVYILRMTAKNEKGTTVSGGRMRVLCVK